MIFLNVFFALASSSAEYALDNMGFDIQEILCYIGYK